MASKYWMEAKNQKLNLINKVIHCNTLSHQHKCAVCRIINMIKITSYENIHLIIYHFPDALL
jgi:hypothetical protein